MDCRAEVGSPTPKWRRPSLEEQLILEEPPVDGRPVIRLTRCPDVTSPLPVAPTKHIASRYTPLEPIKSRNSQQTWMRNKKLSQTKKYYPWSFHYSLLLNVLFRASRDVKCFNCCSRVLLCNRTDWRLQSSHSHQCWRHITCQRELSDSNRNLWLFF